MSARIEKLASFRRRNAIKEARRFESLARFAEGATSMHFVEAAHGYRKAIELAKAESAVVHKPGQIVRWNREGCGF